MERFTEQMPVNTSFFRDRTAFSAIERDVASRLFEGKGERETIRVWVAGCPAGEESYSVAMMLLDQAASLSQPPEIQVFASDANEEAIAVACECCYPSSIGLDVVSARLRSFFIKEPNGYRVNNKTRERILFTVHDVIEDLPFLQLDGIVCRNLLPRFTPEAREKILELFHFSLRPGGFLFLGSAESVESKLESFTLIDEKHRIFRSNRISPDSRPPASLLIKPLAGRNAPCSAEEMQEIARRDHGKLHQQLMERYGPPSVLINSDHDIVHLSEQAGHFLRLAGGEPTNNLLKVVAPKLRLELRAALLLASQQGESAEVRGIQIGQTGRDDQTLSVNLIVHPIRDAVVGKTFFLVIFEEAKKPLHAKDRGPQPSDMEAALHAVEAESQRLKAQLEAAIEQYEATIRGMEASNEEMQTMNEELLSMSEELETSRQEHLSANEELQAVNQELKIRVNQLSSTNDDLQNLISSTDIATLFLDRSLRIKRYTPSALEIFNLMPTDEGRKFTDIRHNCNYKELAADAEKVLATLHKTVREVTCASGRVYLARLLPYRTTNNQIDGVVVNFVDITERKQVEDELRRARTELEEKVQERTRELRGANSGLQFEITKRKEAEGERQRLLRKIVKTQEDERQRISRELHDHLGQQLTALRLGLEMLGKQDRLDDRIADLREMVRQLDSDVDFLAWELRPAALDDFGLVAALANFTEEWSKYFEIAAEFHAVGIKDDRFAPETEINLYRVAQEALNNISKHAQASRVDVILELRDEHVTLIVEDNGVGFNLEQKIIPDVRGMGLGLIGMRERAALIGGTIEIESLPDCGTTIFVRIPFDQQKR